MTRLSVNPIMVFMENKEQKSLYIVDIIRCTACLMIFLYHCNTILPGEFRFLTFFGEDMGNDLFFLISGFALLPSIERAELKDFPRWYLRRLIRILPTLAFFYLLSFLTGFYALKDPAQLFTVFIYPTLYWFVTGILVFYILVFLIMKLCPGAARLLLPVILLILWWILWDKMETYYLSGLLSMLTGALLRESLEKGSFLSRKTPLYPAAFFISFILYMAVKGLKFTGAAASMGILRPVSLSAGILAIASGCFALIWGYEENAALSLFFESRTPLIKIIRKTGLLALSVYMVQCFNAGLIGFKIGEKIPFPLSFAVNLVVIWGAAILTDLIFGKLSRMMSPKDRTT